MSYSLAMSSFLFSGPVTSCVDEATQVSSVAAAAVMTSVSDFCPDEFCWLQPTAADVTT